MVMVWVPNPAFLEAVIVMVELPDPEAMLPGLNETLTPPPAEADNETLELKPLMAAILTVLLVVPPRRTEAGAVALSVKSGAGADELTVTDTVVVCVIPPPIAVMVKL